MQSKVKTDRLVKPQQHAQKPGSKSRPPSKSAAGPLSQPRGSDAKSAPHAGSAKIFAAKAKTVKKPTDDDLEENFVVDDPLPVSETVSDDEMPEFDDGDGAQTTPTTMEAETEAETEAEMDTHADDAVGLTEQTQAAAREKGKAKQRVNGAVAGDEQSTATDKGKSKGRKRKTPATSLANADTDAKTDAAADDSEQKTHTTTTADADEEARKAKKRRKLEKLKAKKAALKQAGAGKTETKTANAGDNIALFDADLQADVVWRLYQDYCVRKKVVAESDQEALAPSHFHTIDNNSDAKSHEIKRLAEHVCKLKLPFAAPSKQTHAQKQTEEKQQQNDTQSSPLLLIVSHSAKRAWDLGNEVKSLSSRKFLELYAKHHKVPEQVKSLQSVVDIAVGTPNRILKLCDMGALSFDRTRLIVLDTHKDAKDFTIFTMQSTRDDLFALMHKHLLAAVRAQPHTKLCLF